MRRFDHVRRWQFRSCWCSGRFVLMRVISLDIETLQGVRNPIRAAHAVLQQRRAGLSHGRVAPLYVCFCDRCKLSLTLRLLHEKAIMRCRCAQVCSNERRCNVFASTRFLVRSVSFIRFVSYYRAHRRVMLRPKQKRGGSATRNCSRTRRRAASTRPAPQRNA